MKNYLVATAAAFSAITLGSVVFVAKAEPEALNIAADSAQEYSEYVCRAINNGASSKEEVFEQATWNYFIQNTTDAPIVAKVLLKDSDRRAARETYKSTVFKTVKSNCPEFYGMPYANSAPATYLD